MLNVINQNKFILKIVGPWWDKYKLRLFMESFSTCAISWQPCSGGGRATKIVGWGRPIGLGIFTQFQKAHAYLRKLKNQGLIF